MFYSSGASVLFPGQISWLLNFSLPHAGGLFSEWRGWRINATSSHTGLQAELWYKTVEAMIPSALSNSGRIWANLPIKSEAGIHKGKWQSRWSHAGGCKWWYLNIFSKESKREWRECERERKWERRPAVSLSAFLMSCGPSCSCCSPLASSTETKTHRWLRKTSASALIMLLKSIACLWSCVWIFLEGKCNSRHA